MSHCTVQVTLKISNVWHFKFVMRLLSLKSVTGMSLVTTWKANCTLCAGSDNAWESACN